MGKGAGGIRWEKKGRRVLDSNGEIFGRKKNVGLNTKNTNSSGSKLQKGRESRGKMR